MYTHTHIHLARVRTFHFSDTYTAPTDTVDKQKKPTPDTGKKVADILAGMKNIEGKEDMADMLANLFEPKLTDPKFLQDAIQKLLQDPSNNPATVALMSQYAKVRGDTNIQTSLAKLGKNHDMYAQNIHILAHTALDNLRTSLSA